MFGEGLSNGMAVKNDSRACMDIYHYGYQSRLMKIDSSGAILWSKSILLYATDVVECNDKGYMVDGNGPVVDYITKYFPTNN